MSDALPDDPEQYVADLREELSDWHREWPFATKLKLLAAVVDLTVASYPEAKVMAKTNQHKQLLHHLHAIRGKARGLVWDQFMRMRADIAETVRQRNGTATETETMGEPTER